MNIDKDDELIAIRQLLAERPAPRPAVVDQARGIVADACAKELPVPRRPRVRPLMLAGITVAAAAALVAVMLTPGSTTPRTAGKRPATELPKPAPTLEGRAARTYLLSMAVRIGQNPSARYLCTDEIQGDRELVGAHDVLLTSPWAPGSVSWAVPASPPAGYRYSIVTRSDSGWCVDGPRDVRDWGQTVGARLASPADTAAWRLDGSPDRWRDGGQWVGTTGGSRFYLPAGTKGPITESWGSDAALPADPAKLRKILLSVIMSGAGHLGVHVSGKLAGAFFATQLLYWAQMVMQAPVSPPVRAAAYQVIAGLPGIQVRPDITDPEGRTGTALWLTASASIDPMAKGGPAIVPGDPGIGSVLIVDPVTGFELADESVTTTSTSWLPAGSVLGYFAYTFRWTSTLPGSGR